MHVKGNALATPKRLAWHKNGLISNQSQQIKRIKMRMFSHLKSQPIEYLLNSTDIPLAFKFQYEMIRKVVIFVSKYQMQITVASFFFPLAVTPFTDFTRDFRATDEIASGNPTSSTPSTEGKSAHPLYNIMKICLTIWRLFLLSEGSLRLVDGQHECEGRLEMYLNSKWGTVCDDAWDIPDAKVVCRQLGCGEAIAAWGEAHFGQGTGTILLDNLKCNGTEASLGNCSHISWDVHNCDHSEDAGVTCSLSWF